MQTSGQTGWIQPVHLNDERWPAELSNNKETRGSKSYPLQVKMQVTVQRQHVCMGKTKGFRVISNDLQKILKSFIYYFIIIIRSLCKCCDQCILGGSMTFLPTSLSRVFRGSRIRSAKGIPDIIVSAVPFLDRSFCSWFFSTLKCKLVWNAKSLECFKRCFFSISFWTTIRLEHS